MAQKESTDREPLKNAKNKKSTSIINAVLVGFMIGIVIYGIVKNGFSFFALIPMFIAYKIFNNSDNKDSKVDLS